MSMAELKVEHSPSTSKFRLPLPNGEEAVLEYREEAEGRGQVWDLYHTEVPPSQRGKGLGAVLAEAAFSHMRSHQLKAKLTCSYLQYYVTKHPKHSDLIQHTQT